MLNPAQEQAVRMQGHCLVTACPGSGKTKVLEHRAAHLLSEPDANVLGVTFTAESAAELEHRIRQQAPSAGRRLVTGTFHALSRKMLIKANVRLRLINDFQQTDLLRRAYRDTIDPGLQITFDDARAYVDRIKAQVDPVLPNHDLEPCVDVYLRYQELLRQSGSADFADLMLLAVRGMRDGSVPAYKTKYMLVDEFQDTDAVQFAWIREHIRQGTAVTVVGDDDQSIYEWRFGMGFQGMEDFRRLTQASHVSLDTTYRCAREIMEPAARLIACNTERVHKSLRTANQTKGSVHVKPFADKEEERSAIAQAIVASGKPGEWAVLARTNAQLEFVEQFIAGRLPVIRSGGTSFWELRGPAMYLSLCRALCNGAMGDLDPVLKRSGISEKRIEAMHAEYRSREAGAVQRFLAAKKGGSSKDPEDRLRILMNQWRSMLASGETNLALHGIAHYMKTSIRLYERDRKPDDKAKDDLRMDNCAAALARIQGSLQQRLMLLQQESKKDGEAVRLMTFHSSKGLEFPNVWIMGCEEGVIPSSNSPLEEERRLFYVGMTRAKLGLTMSYVINEKAPASRFLKESELL